MLIKNANIISMEDTDYENGFILIENDKISDIGEMSSIPIEYNNEKIIIDAKGKLIVPGFIDSHCHIGLCEDGLGFEGDDVNEDSDPVTPNLRAIDGVNIFDRSFDDAKEFGVTTLISSPGSTNPIGGQLCILKSSNKIFNESFGIKFALGENPKNTYSTKSQAPITRMATVGLIREQLYKAKKYLDSTIKAQTEEDSEYPDYDAKCEALLPILKREELAFFHAHRADDILTAIRISNEFNLNYVIIHATDSNRIIEQLEKINAPIIIGPIISDRTKPELQNHTIDTVKNLIEHNIFPAICTDHPETPIQYLSLTASICKETGLNFKEALKCITINPAKICNIDNSVGSIKIGKNADILIFENSPFSILAKPQIVIIDGVIVIGDVKCEK